MGRKSKKWFRMSYAKPRRWVTKHQYGIIKVGRAGGFATGFAGGVIGAMIVRGGFQAPIWTAGLLGGTIGGEIVARKLVKTLKKKLPAKTTYKVPRVRIPTVAQVATAPIAIPFKVGESYGKAWVSHQRKLEAKKRGRQLVPVSAKHSLVSTKGNPFIPKKNYFVR